MVTMFWQKIKTIRCGKKVLILLDYFRVPPKVLCTYLPCMPSKPARAMAKGSPKLFEVCIIYVKFFY